MLEFECVSWGGTNERADLACFSSECCMKAWFCLYIIQAVITTKFIFFYNFNLIQSGNSLQILRFSSKKINQFTKKQFFNLTQK